MKNRKVTDSLNIVIKYIRDGGDWAFNTDDKKVVQAKQYLDENCPNLLMSVVGAIVTLSKDCNGFKTVFAPTNNGIELHYVISDKIEFDMNGRIVESKQANEKEK